jgi:lipopolysaccharide biosynthesis glycosyltransferase
MLQHLHSLEPERNYDSIIFTDPDALTGTLPSTISFRSVRPLMDRIDRRFKDLTFIRPTLTITKETYARLVLNEALGDAYEKCLYVDYDVLFRSPVSSIFSIPIDNADFAAASSLAYLLLSRRNKPGTGLDRFNAGVMLLNLKRFSFERLASKVETFTSSGRLGDQALLNIIYGDDWVRISPKWNLTTRYLTPQVENEIHPIILHFAGGDKPWHRSWVGDPRYRAEMLAILKRYNASAVQHRPRKPILSDRLKAVATSTPLLRSYYKADDYIRRRRGSAAFLAAYRQAAANGDFADLRQAPEVRNRILA